LASSSRTALKRITRRREEPAPAPHKGGGARVENPLFVNSIQKGFTVLQAFSRERPRLTLAAITRLTGLDKSAAQRFLYTLHELGYLRKDEETKQYSLSPKLLEFGYAFLYSDRLIERAQPYLVEAHQRTGETVNLAVLDGSDIILISRIPSRHVISINIQIGIRIPAIYSASGRVIAAGLPPDERRRLLRDSTYHAYTPLSVLDPSEMAKLIDVAASDGFSIVHSQFFSNDISVAAPVHDAAGKVIGAISISAPDSRTTMKEARKGLLPAAAEAARKISVAMGAY
jgi:PcaR/PcaU/PobR family beta-ketoadipate pathway transcriptional regulator